MAAEKKIRIKKTARRVKGNSFPFNGIAARREKKIRQLGGSGKKTLVRRNRGSPRLYMKAVLANYRRGLGKQNNQQAILRVDNVNSKDDAAFYTGKRCCYVYHGYKAKRCVRWNQAPARRSNTRAIWGRVTKPHGGSGALRAKFSTGIPGSALGRRVRVYLYPSTI